jgi:hypothetical protein
MKKRITILWFILLASLSTQANRLLVKSDGAGFAFTSIGEAIDSAQAGDTVVIFPRKDGQTWSITKTLTKPMVFLNGDTSLNLLNASIQFFISNVVRSGSFSFSKIKLSLENNSTVKANLINCEVYAKGKNFRLFEGRFNLSNSFTVDSSYLFHAEIIPLNGFGGNYFSNSVVIGCKLYYTYSFKNTEIISSVFEYNSGSINSYFFFTFEDCRIINSLFRNDVVSPGNTILQLSTTGIESVFANNFIQGKMHAINSNAALGSGNYFVDKTSNFNSTGYEFTQVPLPIQTDSIGRIIGNALVDSGSTIPWLRDVDGSPADVGITGGPFPIQNYINPNPGNAEIIHVNIPRRVGYPNRPIQIKATGTSK